MAHRFAFVAVTAIAALACEDPTRSLAPDAAPSASQAGTSGYTLTDLGTLGGWYSYANNLNDRGMVVGVSLTATDVERAFVWTPDGPNGSGTMHDLGTLPGWDHSGAYAINNHGDIAGYVLNAAATLSRPVRWNRLPSGDYAIEALEHLGGHKGAADAINSQGDLVGADCPPEKKSHIMIWSKQGNRNLGDMGGAAAFAYDINDQGQLAVNHHPILGDPVTSVAYVWSEQGGFRPIGTLGGTGPQDGATAWGINNHGDIAGYSSTPASFDHAFLWTERGGMEDLGTLGGDYSFAYDITGGGDVVGESQTLDGAFRGFIWSRGQGMRDIGGLVDGGWSFAAGINGQGLIAGGSDAPNGEYHAVAWTPGAQAPLSAAVASRGLGRTLSAAKARTGARIDGRANRQERVRILLQ